MHVPSLDNDRFTPQSGLHVTVEVPETHAGRIIDAVLTCDPLKYGDYDRVAFTSAPGTQQFRALGTGHNAATHDVVTVPCTALSFFLPTDDAATVQVLKAIYAAHPYEEPVIILSPAVRTLHIRGLDEDNPNRFWNDEPQDWVPPEHR